MSEELVISKLWCNAIFETLKALDPEKRERYMETRERALTALFMTHCNNIKNAIVKMIKQNKPMTDAQIKECAEALTKRICAYQADFEITKTLTYTWLLEECEAWQNKVERMKPVRAARPQTRRERMIARAITEQTKGWDGKQPWKTAEAIHSEISVRLKRAKQRGISVQRLAERLKQRRRD
jgi:hypothetical protein